MSTPFVITVNGRSEIPHPAERAVLTVVVKSSGINKATVSDEVLTTAKHLESQLRSIAPTDDSDDAKAASPLAHWAKRGFTATSHIPYYDRRNGETEPARQHDASITFDIRFKEFKALGAFGEKLTALPHVEVQDVDWILTRATGKSFRAQLRKEAALDALDKARDYCSAFDMTKVQPVELSEQGTNGVRSNAVHARALAVQQMPGTGGDSKDESPLEFRPEEVMMTMDVTVKFHVS